MHAHRLHWPAVAERHALRAPLAIFADVVLAALAAWSLQWWLSS